MATERRREYTDLGIVLGDREEQVACHASALTFAMTNETCRKACQRCKPDDLHHFYKQQNFDEILKALRLSLTAFSASADHQT